LSNINQIKNNASLKDEDKLKSNKFTKPNKSQLKTQNKTEQSNKQSIEVTKTSKQSNE